MAIRPWGLCAGVLPDLYRLAEPGERERIKLKVLRVSHFSNAALLKTGLCKASRLQRSSAERS
jgi:hypothetical protein